MANTNGSQKIAPLASTCWKWVIAVPVTCQSTLPSDMSLEAVSAKSKINEQLTLHWIQIWLHFPYCELDDTLSLNMLYVSQQEKRYYLQRGGKVRWGSQWSALARWIQEMPAWQLCRGWALTPSSAWHQPSVVRSPKSRQGQRCLQMVYNVLHMVNWLLSVINGWPSRRFRWNSLWHGARAVHPRLKRCVKDALEW